MQSLSIFDKGGRDFFKRLMKVVFFSVNRSWRQREARINLRFTNFSRGQKLDSLDALRFYQAFSANYRRVFVHVRAVLYTFCMAAFSSYKTYSTPVFNLPPYCCNFNQPRKRNYFSSNFQFSTFPTFLLLLLLLPKKKNN